MIPIEWEIVARALAWTAVNNGEWCYEENLWESYVDKAKEICEQIAQQGWFIGKMP